MLFAQSLRTKPSQDSLNSCDTRSTTSLTPAVLAIPEEVDDKVILYETSHTAIYKLPVTSAPRDYDSPPKIPSYLLQDNNDSESNDNSNAKISSSSTYQHLLVAEGKFQIFKMLGQSAAYFKCGQFVHPILPKMRMWRIMFSEFVLPQPNPGKFWRLKVFNLSTESADLLEVILCECCYYQSMYTPPSQLSIPLVEPEIYKENAIEEEPRTVGNAANKEEFKSKYDVSYSCGLGEEYSLDLLGFPLIPGSPESCIDSDSTTETLANSLNDSTYALSEHEFDFTQPEAQASAHTTIGNSPTLNNVKMFLSEKDFDDHFFTNEGKEDLGDFLHPSPTLAEINSNIFKDNDADCAASTSSCSTLDLILDSFDDLAVNYSNTQDFSKKRLVHYEQDLMSHRSSNASNIFVQVHHHHHHYYPESFFSMQHVPAKRPFFNSPQTPWKSLSQTRSNRSLSVKLPYTPVFTSDTKSLAPMHSESQKTVPTVKEVLSPLLAAKASIPISFSKTSIGKRSKSFSVRNLLEPFQFSAPDSTTSIRNCTTTTSAASTTTSTHLQASTESPLLDSWNTVVSQSLPWDKLNLDVICKNTLIN
jgi:hypothetical protein